MDRGEGDGEDERSAGIGGGGRVAPGGLDSGNDGTGGLGFVIVFDALCRSTICFCSAMLNFVSTTLIISQISEK